MKNLKNGLLAGLRLVALVSCDGGDGNQANPPGNLTNATNNNSNPSSSGANIVGDSTHTGIALFIDATDGSIYATQLFAKLA